MISKMTSNSDVILKTQATIPGSGTQIARCLLLCFSFSPKYSHFIAQPHNSNYSFPWEWRQLPWISKYWPIQNLFMCLFSNAFCLWQGYEFWGSRGQNAMDWMRPLQIHILKFQAPVPQSVTILGDRSFKGVIKLKMRPLIWGSNPIWLVSLIRRGRGTMKCTNTEKRPCENTMRRLSSASQRQSLQKKTNLPTPWSWSWNCSLQTYKKVNFYCLSHLWYFVKEAIVN